MGGGGCAGGFQSEDNKPRGWDGSTVRMIVSTVVCIGQLLRERTLKVLTRKKMRKDVRW